MKKISKYIGVNFDVASGKWIAKMPINKKQIRLGCFLSEHEAFQAINKKKNELGLEIQDLTECNPLEGEIFKPMANNKEYEISNLGRIKSFKFGRETILKQNIGCRRYFHVVINGKNLTVHKLVAMAFLGHKPDGTQRVVVDHINGNSKDNRLSNLQLITQRENASKDRKNGTSEYIGVSVCKSGKFMSQIIDNGKNVNLGRFHTEQEASEYYQNALRAIENGEEIKHNRKEKSSKYKGVYFCKTIMNWISYIYVNNRLSNLGSFETEEEAYNYLQNALIAVKNGKDIVKKVKPTSSMCEGVIWDKSRNKWKSEYYHSDTKKRTYIGRFITEQEAFEAREEYINK